jgi:hypothetical protein
MHRWELTPVQPNAGWMSTVSPIRNSIRQLGWPVIASRCTRIGPRLKPHAADGALHCYLLYRDHDDVVRFTVLNAVTARLLELLRDEALTGGEALRRIAQELNRESPQALVQSGRTMLDHLIARRMSRVAPADCS